MRSSRLLALTLMVQRTGSTTAARLAAELEVSVRTVYRDLRALQDAGVPIWTTAGAHGGVHIVDGWRSPIDGITTEEASALLIGRSGAADLGLAGVLATAQSKVRSGLPADVRAQIDAVTSRVHLDTQGWFRPNEPLPALPQVAVAVWSGRRLDIVYAAGQRPVRRRLDPLGLVLKAGTWYLVAAHRGRPRTYRLSRIGSVAVRDDAAHRPDGFDLAEYWAASAGAFDASIRRLEAVVRMPQTSLRALRRSIPGHVTEEAIARGTVGDDGTMVIDLAVENVHVAVSQLVPVPGIEVLAPVELRQALAAHVRELARRNEVSIEDGN